MAGTIHARTTFPPHWTQSKARLRISAACAWVSTTGVTRYYPLKKRVSGLPLYCLQLDQVESELQLTSYLNRNPPVRLKPTPQRDYPIHLGRMQSSHVWPRHGHLEPSFGPDQCPHIHCSFGSYIRSAYVHNVMLRRVLGWLKKRSEFCLLLNDKPMRHLQMW